MQTRSLVTNQHVEDTLFMFDLVITLIELAIAIAQLFILLTR
ncbi:hypothetical protein VIBNIPon4_150022 [Vibrio nigripulchritudo POn4]|nr:hypothetical protein VIBNIFTn2_1610022 [Vibrio nigripulchritudo FTn2]CCN63692.1 hypothetical protein VIBNIPon4_150022 [Vibrio nigripulchritudo POn4]